MTELRSESHTEGKGAFQAQRGADAWKATAEKKAQVVRAERQGWGSV